MAPNPPAHGSRIHREEIDDDDIIILVVEQRIIITSSSSLSLFPSFQYIDGSADTPKQKQTSYRRPKTNPIRFTRGIRASR